VVACTEKRREWESESIKKGRKSRDYELVQHRAVEKKKERMKKTKPLR
jgi:hypothetical protein